MQAVDRAVLFASLWSVGAALRSEAWPAFDVAIRKLLETEKMDVGIPASGLCFDYFVRSVYASLYFLSRVLGTR